MNKSNIIKGFKIAIAIVIGYFALNILSTALNIALGLAIKLLIVIGLGVGILYGVKMLKKN